MLKLGSVRFVDIVYINLKIFQAVKLYLISAKLDFGVISLLLTYTIF